MVEHDGRVRLLIAGAALGAALACGDSGGGDGVSGAGGSGGSGGDGMADSGTAGGGGDLPNTGEINLDCPDLAPLDGEQAARGACCHRVSNIEREKLLDPNEGAALEYRLQYTLTKNHPSTIGDPTIVSAVVGAIDTARSNTLWTFYGPRENGETVSGPGYTIIGGGRYNCDGTYSYYSETAAPVRDVEGRDDPARWAARQIENVVDVTLHGRDRSQVPWAMNRNREIAFVPYMATADWSLEWELASQGFDIEEIDTEGDGRDCIGSRMGTTWAPAGTFRIYSPMEPNDIEPIPTALGQTQCGLTGFGLSIPGPTVSCKETPRCTPGTSGCTWKKLPDSLCPVTADEMSKWGCHVGDENNEGDVDYPTGYPTNCTETEPTDVLDPDLDPGVSEGQCCDPLGASTTLPPCNAWLLRQDYVAAAAEITDERANELPSMCE